jgi:hypothetical protein
LTLFVASEAAHEWLERYLEAAEGPTDFVLTGPATNLNWALQRRPHLASKVGRVFWMAGAVDVDGNIRDSDDDKPQERGVGARVQGGHLYISSSSIYEILRMKLCSRIAILGKVSVASKVLTKILWFIVGEVQHLKVQDYMENFGARHSAC